MNEIQMWENYQQVIAAYNLAFATLSYDDETIAPRDGSSYRNEKIAVLKGEYLSFITSDEIIACIQSLLSKPQSMVEQRKLQLTLKEINQLKAVSKEEYITYVECCRNSSEAWKKAKENNDYSIFKPHLKEVIEQTKHLVSLRNDGLLPYDSLLADYEEGSSMEFYDKFFEKIKTHIVPLVKKLREKNIQYPSLEGVYPIEQQKMIMEKIASYLQFNPSWGYLSQSVHPFSSGFSKNDTRITVRYDESDVTSAIFALIHEIGHATVEHQIGDEYEGSIIHRSITSGIHESQSRFYENYLGKNKSFWKNNYPYLQNMFSNQLNDISLDDFMKAINQVKHQSIRLEADELTYPLHILIRYECEKGLFNGTISIDELEDTFNRLIKEYLGIEVTNPNEGILQDIHWSEGEFGYFPAYALGSSYGAQLLVSMKKEIVVEQALENNQMEVIHEWLKNHIHHDGALYLPLEIIEKACKEPFNVSYYIDYLIDKYSSSLLSE